MNIERCSIYNLLWMMDYVLVLSGTTTVGNVTDISTASSFDDSPEMTTVVDTKEEPAPTISVTEDDEDDTMSYFEKLAEEN